MAKLSIGTAWNETAAFVKREGSLLFPIALALIALPSILVQWLTPTVPPGESPPVGLWTWLLFPMMIVTLLGSLSVVILALRRETLVGAALATAGRRLLPLLGALILFVLMMAAVVFPLVVIGALLSGGGEVTAQSPGVTLTVVVVMLALLLLSVRFLLANQVAAATDLGPVGILKRSWALTRGHFWKLFALLLLVGIVLVVLAMAVTAIGGIVFALLTGSAQPGSLGGFLVLVVVGLLNGVFTVYLLVLLTRVYEQLAGEPTTGI